MTKNSTTATGTGSESMRSQINGKVKSLHCDGQHHRLEKTEYMEPQKCYEVMEWDIENTWHSPVTLQHEVFSPMIRVYGTNRTYFVLVDLTEGGRIASTMQWDDLQLETQVRRNTKRCNFTADIVFWNGSRQEYEDLKSMYTCSFTKDRLRNDEVDELKCSVTGSYAQHVCRRLPASDYED